MTYLRFHLLFNLPLLVLLFLLTAQESWSGMELGAVALVLLAVFVFTVPWDNLAAKWGIWRFPRDKYLFALGYLPVEEYAFFLLQSLNVMLGVRAALYYRPAWHVAASPAPTLGTWLCLGISAVAWLLLAERLRRYRRHAGSRTHYALHLVWFLPVIYFQWVLAPILLLDHVGVLALITLAFGFYYTAADLVAIRGGTWTFDEKQIGGGKIAGVLPWEEMAFFLLTSLLVAQSYLLLAPPFRR